MLHEPSHLVSDQQTAQIMQLLETDYDSILSQLRASSEEKLTERIKTYDNYNRFTLGRMISRKVPGHILIDGRLSSNLFNQIYADDPSQLPNEFNEQAYPGIWQAIKYSVNQMTNNLQADEHVLISVYCHRVLVRPGEEYAGFCHRDNKGLDEKCGTAVWYPRVQCNELSGLAVFCYLNRPDETDEEITSRAPDLRYEKDAYNKKVLILQYPYNLIHGVQFARHDKSNGRSRDKRVQDFLEPADEHSVKDLIVITLSDQINAED